MVVHACNPSTWETEIGRLRMGGHSGLHSETLSQETKRKEKRIEMKKKIVYICKEIKVCVWASHNDPRSWAVVERRQGFYLQSC
jgi:hypothetical protein